MKVKNIGSNQTEIQTENYTVLVSYETPVAAFEHKTGVYYRTIEKFSKTTTKHINNWLDGVNAEKAGQEFFNTLL